MRAFEQLRRKRKVRSMDFMPGILFGMLVIVSITVYCLEEKQYQQQLRIATAYRDILRTTGYECTASPAPDRVVDCIEMEQKAVHPIPLVEGIEQ